MTCITREFGCSCAENECAVPHYEILEQAVTTMRERLVIAAFAVFVLVAALSYAGFQINNAIIMAEIEERV